MCIYQLMYRVHIPTLGDKDLVRMGPQYGTKGLKDICLQNFFCRQADISFSIDYHSGQQMLAKVSTFFLDMKRSENLKNLCSVLQTKVNNLGDCKRWLKKS